MWKKLFLAFALVVRRNGQKVRYVCNSDLFWSHFGLGFSERRFSNLSVSSAIIRLVDSCTFFQPEKRIMVQVVVAILKDTLSSFDDDPTSPKMRRASLPHYSLAEAVVNEAEPRYARVFLCLFLSAESWKSTVFEFKVQCLQRLRVKGYLTLDAGDEVVLRDHDSCKGGVALGWCGHEYGKVMVSALDLHPHLGNDYLKACKPLSEHAAALVSLFNSKHVLLEAFTDCLAAARCLFSATLTLFKAEIRDKTERGLETEQFREGSPSVVLLTLLFGSHPATEFAASFAKLVLIQAETLSSMSPDDAVLAIRKVS